METAFKVIAGESALPIIRDEGLSAKRIRVIAGAAGGPKWLILAGLDQLIMKGMFQGRKDPLFMIGSSIGSWRFAALARKNAQAAVERFKDAYLAQSYSPSPTPGEVTWVSRRILDDYIPDRATGEVMDHPFIRLGILTVRSGKIFAPESRPILFAGMAAAGLCNSISRKSMGLFFTRSLFYDPRDIPPYVAMDGFPIHRIPLDENNLKPSIMASGSIPLVMLGQNSIPGAPDGVYRDGGMIDYHPSMTLDEAQDRIVLFPHYTDRVIPGWLDKHIPWRRAGMDAMRNVCIVCPSSDFIARLPHGKIPDRNDFARFRGRDGERREYWSRAVSMGKQFAEEFIEAVDSGKIRTMATAYRPF